MNRAATKLALANLNSRKFYLKAALFHSTPVLDRGRRCPHCGSVGRSSGSRSLSKELDDIVSWLNNLHAELNTGHRFTNTGTGIYLTYNNTNNENNNSNYNNNSKNYNKNKKTNNKNNNNSNHRDSRQRFEDEDSNPSRVTTDLREDRIALGLSGSGPLSLEDVKTAYRACALKWHPDHHKGFFKAIAEEKFKVCSDAYRSLCDKLEPK
ncbi:uncharacterized protein LOC143535514 [Bidens hawaiensis]|uniref:uncharacterized protein LOC143535514 n=1 Tax=Bidens hawaiensis TaxID=980011 RepID=UPI00404995F8